MNKKITSKNHVNEKVVRLVAAQVIFLTLFTLVTGWIWPALFLAADFALRAFTRIPSPLAIIAKGLTRAFGLTPKPIFAPPKRFAAGLGLVFSLSIAIFLYYHYLAAVYVTGGILIACAILEAVFNICLGCYVYNWVVAPIVNRNAGKRKGREI
ncbi:DUF4395 domain-containing protein [Proteiniphilum sp.]|uniref:DUF4395 domain-containing protein n=1 Tax=Proteiniphilum sp. TaxID=1926877 RepID=UPI002B1E98A0|nr:DUF4395 domain-containing protein [Proteiniphilum sp.]MEA4918293.1 DUF4395 domain-containing protein [Proteiniphilum sp.]